MENDRTEALAVGIVLHGENNYTIEKVLGSGGFGITYLASTEKTWVNGTSIRRRVALKELFYRDFCERGSDGMTIVTPTTARIRAAVDGVMSDFLAEARRLQALGSQNPNIVHVSEVFLANNTAYYAMDYLEGVSLGNAVLGKPIDEAAMLAVMKPIIAAVAFLHSKGIIHLDIKPDNIVLADGGERPVLIDFGQSRHFLGDGAATDTVNIKGVSHGYSPAEQYAGISSFATTADVYALGATMVTCLTGTVPPKSLEWLYAAKTALIDGLPVSPQTKTVIACALAADPRERFADAGAMLAAMGGAAVPGNSEPDASGIPAPPAPSASPVYDYNVTKHIAGARQPQPGRKGDPVSPPAPPRHYNSKKKNWVFALIIIGTFVILGIGVFFAIGGKEDRSEPTPAESIYVDETVEDQMAASSPQRHGGTPVAEEDVVEEVVAPAEGEEVVAPAEEAVAAEGEEVVVAEEAVAEVAQPASDIWDMHRRAENLYLAVERQGRQYYFSEQDWNGLDGSMKAECRKLGVVIDKDGQRFILTLNDAANGRRMKWNEAMRQYGSHLPTRRQGEAWMAQRMAVRRAVRAFGGYLPAKNDRDGNQYYLYWTCNRESYGDHAYMISIFRSDVTTTSFNSECRIRTIEALDLTAQRGEPGR